MFYQTSLFGSLAPEYDATFGELVRLPLDATTWVDLAPGWLRGADQVYDELVATLPLRQRTGVKMYDQVVDEPRLSAWWRAEHAQPEPLPILRDIRLQLSSRYDEPFDSIGFNLYRDGNDSVAWHGDRHRHVVTNPVIAIVSVGAPAAAPAQATRWRQLAQLEPRQRRPVRDGRRMPARLGAHRSEGARHHRAATQHHVPVGLAERPQRWPSTLSAATADPRAPAMSRSATSANEVTSRCSSRSSVWACTRSRNQSRNDGSASITPPPSR